MSLYSVARNLIVLGINIAEAITYHIFDFDEPADKLWSEACDRLVEREAEEEVAEPHQSSSVADPSPEATDEQPPRSAPNHGVERGGLQLTGISRTDVLSAVAALRAVGDQRGPENRDYWNSVADRFDAVYAEM